MDIPFTWKRRLLVWALQTWDVAVLLSVLVVSWSSQAADSGRSTLLEATDWHVGLWLLGSAILWQLVSSRSHLHESRRLSRGAGETWDLVRSLALGLALGSWLGVALGIEGLSLTVLVWAWLAATSIAVGSRFALRIALSALRRSGRNLRQVLVVGSGPRARMIAQELLSHDDLGYRIIGCIDDRDPGVPVSAGLTGIAPDQNPLSSHPERAGEVAGESWLGPLDAIDRVLANNVVDEVVVALPLKSAYDKAASVMRACERQGISVSLPVNFFDTDLLPLRLEVVRQIPLLRYASHRVTGWPAFFKRSLDVVVSALLLILLSPLFLVLALLIKLTSPGPVFFVQDRVGLHKRVFRLIKFRTMVNDAERRLEQLLHLNEVSGPVFKLRNDPRLTTVGGILRRLSIDELPQLFNVLSGDMSLVGPRPLPLRDVQGFSEDSMRRRFSVKPGITCFWQVSGRSQVAFEKWMELDMHYIETWSLGLDLKILLRTVPAVLRGTGAH